MQPTQGTFLGIVPVSLVSNGLYFLTLLLVSIMHIIYTSKGMSKKFGVRVIYRKIQYIDLMVLCTCYMTIPFDFSLFKVTFNHLKLLNSCLIFSSLISVSVKSLDSPQKMPRHTYSMYGVSKPEMPSSCLT